MNRIILPSGMTIDLDAASWTSTLRMADGEAQMTVQVGGKSLILRGVDAHTFTRALMTTDHVHVDASEKEKQAQFAADIAFMLHAKLEDALIDENKSHQGVSESNLFDRPALIEAGFARVNRRHPRLIIITQRGIDHFKSML